MAARKGHVGDATEIPLEDRVHPTITTVSRAMERPEAVALKDKLGRGSWVVRSRPAGYVVEKAR